MTKTPDMFLVKDICYLLRPMNVGGMGGGGDEFIARCLKARLDRVHACIAYCLDDELLREDGCGRFLLTPKGLELIA